MRLSGRTVLVTGGNGGIGLGLAEAFSAKGSKVIICGRNMARLSAVEQKYPGITALRCDVGDGRQRLEFAEEVLRRFPDLDILVNNAGIQRYVDLRKGYAELKAGEDEIAINFVSVVELTALFINHLLTKPSAAVINVSSGLGFMPMASAPIYSATKAAIHAYSLVLRQQLTGTSVKVMEIVPSMVDTGLNKAGRDAARLKYRGVSLADYVPTVIKGLEDDVETIFHGDQARILSEPRGESEVRLLKPSW
jgi:uncharacterized oxidoreductase